MEREASRSTLFPSLAFISLVAAAAETEVKQLQESLAALRHDVEKTIGDRAQPLSATDVERTVYASSIALLVPH